MTTTAIKNKTRALLVINLSREVAPRRAHYPRVIAHANGTVERKDVRIVSGDSLHILAGETRGGLSNAVRRCPEVIAAKAARKIELIEEPDVVVTPAEPVVPAPVVTTEPALPPLVETTSGDASSTDDGEVTVDLDDESEGTRVPEREAPAKPKPRRG